MIKLKDYLETNDQLCPFRLPGSVLNRVLERAKAHKTTKSKYIRAAILKMLDEDTP